MFLHVSVILFTWGSAPVHAGIPRADPLGQTPPLGRHPLPWADTPWADTPVVHAGIYFKFHNAHEKQVVLFSGYDTNAFLRE